MAKKKATKKKATKKKIKKGQTGMPFLLHPRNQVLVQVSTKVPHWLWVKLKDRAETTSKSISYVVRESLAAYLTARKEG
jgi:hypothetical protein